MSNEMPKVGDVWANKHIENKIVHVFGIYQNGWGKYVCYGEYYPTDMEVICGNTGLNFFLADYNYLGKSKAKINQLFEVTNKENDAKVILELLLRKNPEMRDWAVKNFPYLLNEVEVRDDR